MANNIIIAHKQLATAITNTGGTGTVEALNDTKSSYITAGATVITTCTTTGGNPYLVMVFLPDATGTVSMTINGVTITATISSEVNAIGYGGGAYLTYYGTTATTSISITGLSGKKISKILVANYYQGQYNIPYGFSAGYEDLSNYERSQAGDLVTTNAPRYKTMALSLAHISEGDKQKIYNIIKDCGKFKCLFVSIYPNNTDTSKSQIYSIYGKMNSIVPVTQDNYILYSSNLDLIEF